MAQPSGKLQTYPEMVYAEASVRSLGDVSLFAPGEIVTSRTVDNFYSDPADVRRAVELLREAGFDVLDVGDTTINIAAPSSTFEEIFGTTIQPDERTVIKEFAQETTATFLDTPDTEVSGLIDPAQSPMAEVLEGISLNEPVYYFQNAFPPPAGYWHLDVPADVSLGMNADRAHRVGLTGRGVRVVMVDSGWYRHSFFIQRGYRANPVVLGPGTADPDHDGHGHGTGESANVYSVAPDVTLTMVKMSSVNAVGAFKAAVALRPQIISCSWGWNVKGLPLSSTHQAIAAAVADAVRRGIIVVFAAGNCQYGFPAQHPDVIAVGGVFMHPDGSVEATDYASGFSSGIYKKRVVPDVCGLVGKPPRAQYIMLPVEAKCYLDKTLAGGTHPNGDETAPDDGWAAFSGTSAAAPQIAGVCALVKQACRRLGPHQVRAVLKKTARDVTSGQSCQGNKAASGPDLATGHGLADAFRAAMLARIRCWIRPVPILPRPPIVGSPVIRPVRPPILAEEEEWEEEIQLLEEVDDV